MRLHTNTSIAFSTFGLFIASILLIPLGAIAINLFVPSGGAWEHLLATVMPEYVANSLALLIWVALGVIIFGTGCAWLTAHCEFPGRSLCEWLLVLPLAMPAYVMAYAYTDLLQYTGPVQEMLRALMGWRDRSDYWFPEVRSLTGAALMFIFVLYPYVYMLARVAFLEQSSAYQEVGRTFGYSLWKMFWRVSLPLARPAIVAGTSLALMEVLADFGTVSYFGVQTFATGIYRAWFSMGDAVTSAKLAMMLLGFVVVLLVGERFLRRRARYFHGGKSAPPRLHLYGARAIVAFLFCLLPLSVGFFIPLIILIKMTFLQGDPQWASHFSRLIWNSVTLAVLASLLITAIAAILTYAVRLQPSKLLRSVNRLAGLGYAVPGVVIAIGVLIPVTQLDHRLAHVLQNHFGLNVGLIFTGSIAALIYAYLIRFLALAQGTVETGLARITPSMDDAARSLGLTPLQTFFRVHIPLLWGSLGTASLLVFVDVMKELPATLVMRPFNFDTLAVQAYNLASDERLSEASTASLAIVMAGLIPVIIASRQIAKSARQKRGNLATATDNLG